MPARGAGNKTVGAGNFGDWWIPGEYSVNDHGILSVLLHRSHGSGRCKASGRLCRFFPAGIVLYFLFFALLFAAIFALCKMYRAHNLWERLCYLGEYVWDVVRCGQWRVYFAEDRASEAAGICMAGPILCSVLLYVGGIY